MGLLITCTAGSLNCFPSRRLSWWGVFFGFMLIFAAPSVPMKRILSPKETTAGVSRLLSLFISTSIPLCRTKQQSIQDSMIAESKAGSTVQHSSALKGHTEGDLRCILCCEARQSHGWSDQHEHSCCCKLHQWKVTEAVQLHCTGLVVYSPSLPKSMK